MKKYNIILCVMALIFSAAITAPVDVYGWQKSDYLTLVKSEVGVSYACSYYTSNYMAASTANDMVKLNKSTIWAYGGEYAAGPGAWEYWRAVNYSVKTYKSIERCEYRNVTDNLTGKILYEIKTCNTEMKPAEDVIKTRYEWAQFLWNTPAQHIRFCAQLKVMLGPRSIDHVPTIGNYSFPEYSWWNSSCSVRINMSVRNLNMTAIMPLGSQVSLSVRHGDYVAAGQCAKSDGSDIFLTFNGTEIDRINETAFGNGLNLTWKLQQALSPGGATADYALYCNCSGMTAPKNSVANIAPAWGNATGAWFMNSNITVIDETGGVLGRPLNAVGTLRLITNSTCQFGNCLYFDDNSGNYLNGSTFLGSAYSSYLNGITFLFSGADQPGVENTLFSKMTSNTNNVFYASGEGTPGDIYAGFQASSTQTLNYYRPYDRNLSWHTYGFTHARNGTNYIYGDGRQGNYTNAASNFFPADGDARDFYVGLGVNYNNPYKGYIDRLIVFNAVFNATDMLCLARPTSQYPFTVCLNAPAVGNITGIDGYVVPPPVVIPSNITVFDAEQSYCLDSRYFYQRVAIPDQSGALIMNNKTTYCDYGCQNFTLTSLGSAGCQESPLIFYLMLIAVAIAVTLLIVWLGRRSI